MNGSKWTEPCISCCGYGSIDCYNCKHGIERECHFEQAKDNTNKEGEVGE